MSTPTPDYGEPWRKEIMGGIVGKTDDFMVLPYMDYEGLDWDSETLRDRAITCVNACAGISDPAAHLAAMREAIREAVDSLEQFIDQSDGLWNACEKARATITKLQPFIK